MRILFLLLSLCLFQCEGAALAQQPILPADTAKQVEQALKDGRGVRYHVRDLAAEGVGASGQASGDKTDLKVDQTAPHAELPGGGGASGGDNKAHGSASVASDPLRLFFGIASLAAFGGCAWFVFRKNPRGAALSFVAGVGFAIAAIWPAFALLAIGIAFAVHYGGHFMSELFHPDAIAQAATDTEAKLGKLKAKLGLPAS